MCVGVEGWKEEAKKRRRFEGRPAMTVVKK
jgi:hypothetical protein